MPADQKQYIIPTGVLFHLLNVNRQSKGLANLEDALIARKLGILFTFKTNNYRNFKIEFVKLNDGDLLILTEIFNQYFNVNINEEKLKYIAIEPNNANRNEKLHQIPEKQSFFSKIKGFLKS
jgi:hypothetical protein